MTKAKLGQHFLTRPEIAQWVATCIPLNKKSVVLEIGPGHGILTKELLKVVDTVVAVEKDTVLVEELKETFTKEIASGKLVLLKEDIRNFSAEDCTHLSLGYSLVANIPYYITGYIIRKFLTTKHQPANISILIQKEVAERIVAKNLKHSLLSLSVHAYGTPKLEKVVKAGAFSPPPKVDSAILSIQNISRQYFDEKTDESAFFELLHTAFSQKRKTLGSTLRKTVPTERFERCNVDKKARPEDMPLEKWFCLVKN
jgi:16S rRNA (adenine1518-N6/adenine1519-N6)-dimethyltransferase